MQRTHHLIPAMTAKASLAWSLFLGVLLLCSTASAMPLQPPGEPQGQPPAFNAPLTEIHTLQSAPSMPFTAQPTLTPRAARVADWLLGRLTTYNAGDSGLTQGQAEALANLRARFGTDVHVRMGDGTPRLLKAEVLQPALQNFAPGKNRAQETAWAFLHANKALLQIERPGLELLIQRHHHDALGYQHLRFTQTYEGLPVWPKADLIVHLDPAGDVYMMNGIYISTPSALQTAPTLSANEALHAARNAVPGGNGAIVSSPELLIYTPESGAPLLAWRVDVTVSLSAHWRVAVDAHSGDILTSFNRVMTQNRQGSGIDLFGVTQNINVWQEGNLFFLVDTSKLMFDPTSNPPNPSTTRGAIVIQDARNQPPTNEPQTIPPLFDITSSSATSGWLADGVSAMYGFSETYDYYLERHNRNSLDDRGGQILAAVRIGQNYFNAAFIPGLQMMIFGDALPFAGALDVVGHELTHGVINNSADLIYQDQSGALNEAYADIFGEMVEARTNGSTNWEIGSQIGITIRNMQDPSSIEICCGRGYPSKMSEFITVDDPVLGDIIREDNGGVHINSSIINHAYYQLAEGLNGAIGTRDAELIFYRALTTQLVRSSQFIDARFACIQSAEELFGAGSNQAIKTAEAFDFVEIFDADAAIFATRAPSTAGTDAWFLARRDPAAGDPAEGVIISRFNIQPSKPAVTGNGQSAFFVDAVNDLCAIPTDGNSEEACAGNPNTVHAVTVAPSGRFAAVVLLDNAGEPDNQILLIDLVNQTSQELPLLAPVQDGVPIGTVLFADVMDFTSDDRFLFYDALNEVTLSDGTPLRLWSLYAIDLRNDNTLIIVAPTPGSDVGNPAVGQTSDILLTFERRDNATGTSDIFAGNLNTGDAAMVGQVQNTLGFPGYTSDDRAIVYSVFDANVRTGTSLVQHPLASDGITPAGSPQPWLSNGYLGVIYSRSTGVALTPIGFK